MSSTRTVSKHSVSRFIRVVFSAFISLVVSSVIAAGLWSDGDAHYTFNAARPLFTAFLLFPFVLAFAILLSVPLYFLDRWALRWGGLGRWKSAVLVSVLCLGAAAGFLDSSIGSFGLFLLLYWLLSGRVAGRPGWSLRGFRSTAWDEKIYVIAFAAVLVPWFAKQSSRMLYDIFPVELGTPELRVERANRMTADVKRALRRFPDAQSCLIAGADAANREDLVHMDWDRIRTSGDAKVCSFRLLQGWGGVSDAASWMVAQGYHVRENFSSAKPYVGRDGTLRVDGSWSVKTNGPRFPTSGFVRRVWAAIPYGEGISATYGPDGQELWYVGLSSTSL